MPHWRKWMWPTPNGEIVCDVGSMESLPRDRLPSASFFLKIISSCPCCRARPMERYLLSWDATHTSFADHCGRAVAAVVQRCPSPGPGGPLFADVKPVGSYLTRTGVVKSCPLARRGAAPSLSFDLAAGMRSSASDGELCCTAEDIDAGHYLEKRADHVACLAAYLAASTGDATGAKRPPRGAIGEVTAPEGNTTLAQAAKEAALLVTKDLSAATPAEFHCAVSVRTTAVISSSSSGGGSSPLAGCKSVIIVKWVVFEHRDDDGDATPLLIAEVSVHVRPTACSGKMQSAKVAQQKALLYASLVLEDYYMPQLAGALHKACKDCPSLAKGIVLAKAWARTEGLVADAPHDAADDEQQAAAGGAQLDTGLNGFVFSAMLLKLFMEGTITPEMTDEHVLRLLWVAIGRNAFQGQPLCLADSGVSATLASSNKKVPATADTSKTSKKTLTLPPLFVVVTNVCHLNVAYRAAWLSPDQCAKDLVAAARRALQVTATASAPSRGSDGSSGSTLLTAFGLALPTVARYDTVIPVDAFRVSPEMLLVAAKSSATPLPSDSFCDVAAAGLSRVGDAVGHPLTPSRLLQAYLSLLATRHVQSVVAVAFGEKLSSSRAVMTVAVAAPMPKRPPPSPKHRGVGGGVTSYAPAAMTAQGIVALAFIDEAAARSRLFRGPPLEDVAAGLAFDQLWTAGMTSTRQFADGGAFKCVVWPLSAPSAGFDVTEPLSSAPFATSHAPLESLRNITAARELADGGLSDAVVDRVVSVVGHLIGHHVASPLEIPNKTTTTTTTMLLRGTHGADVYELLREPLHAGAGLASQAPWVDVGPVTTSALRATWDLVRQWITDVCEGALPGKIASVQAVGSELRGTTAFPSRPQHALLQLTGDERAGARRPTAEPPAPSGSAALNFASSSLLSAVATAMEVTPLSVIAVLDDHGKIPDSVEAIDAMKRALLAQLAVALRDSSSAASGQPRRGAGGAAVGKRSSKPKSVAATPSDMIAAHALVEVSAKGHLDIVVRGFLFRVVLGHYREVSLLRALGRTAEAQQLERRVFWTQRHHVFIETLTRMFPSAAMSVRLARRWIASMHLADYVAAEAVELLIAFCYQRSRRSSADGGPMDRSQLLATPRLVTCFPHGVLVQFWELLATWDFRLPIDLHDLADAGSDDVAAPWADSTSHEDAAVAAPHAPPPQLQGLVVRTPYCRDRSPFTEETPRPMVMQRLRECAINALDTVNTCGAWTSAFALDTRFAYDITAGVAEVGSTMREARRTDDLLDDRLQRQWANAGSAFETDAAPGDMAVPPATTSEVSPFRVLYVSNRSIYGGSMSGRQGPGAWGGMGVPRDASTVASRRIMAAVLSDTDSAIRALRSSEKLNNMVLRDEHDFSGGASSIVGLLNLGGRAFRSGPSLAHAALHEGTREYPDADCRLHVLLPPDPGSADAAKATLRRIQTVAPAATSAQQWRIVAPPAGALSPPRDVKRDGSRCAAMTPPLHANGPPLTGRGGEVPPRSTNGLDSRTKGHPRRPRDESVLSESDQRPPVQRRIENLSKGGDALRAKHQRSTTQPTAPRPTTQPTDDASPTTSSGTTKVAAQHPSSPPTPIAVQRPSLRSKAVVSADRPSSSATPPVGGSTPRTHQDAETPPRTPRPQRSSPTSRAILAAL